MTVLRLMEWFFGAAPTMVVVALAWCVGFFFWRERRGKVHGVAVRGLLWAAGFWQVFYAAALTAGQYWVWSLNPFTRLFLTLPADGAYAPVARLLNALTGGRGYFFYYCFGRFWLPAILAIGLAIVMYAVFAGVRFFRPNGFTRDDVRILTLFALAFPWPLGLAFYVFAFLAALLFSFWSAVMRTGRLATITVPALVSAAVVLLWKGTLLRLLLRLL